jgi:hypothetical protein
LVALAKTSAFTNKHIIMHKNLILINCKIV